MNLILSVLLVLSLASCSNKNAKNDTSVDCTWDGQDNNTRYDYFLLGKSEYPYGITGGLSLATSRYSE